MAVWLRRGGSEELRVRLLPSCPRVLVSSYVSGRADRPRSAADQRDAGPYPARRVFAGGWGLAVGGWVEEAMGRADRPGRPGGGLTHGVRHIIAARDEARPHVSAEGRALRDS